VIRNLWYSLISGLLLVAGVVNLASAEGLRAVDSKNLLVVPQGPLELGWSSGLFQDPNDNGNTAPVAVGDSYTTAEDTALLVNAPGVLENDTDVDGDALTAVLVSGPSHGTLTLNANGSFTYMPALNYSGADSFTYKANDGQADSNVTTVNLTIDVKRPQPPTWIEPVGNGETYILRGDSVILGVTVADSDVSYVVFRGYNHQADLYYEIGRVYGSPYRISLARNNLIPDDPNQIFAEAVDAMGNSSLDLSSTSSYEATARRIFIEPTSMRFQIFLPMVSR